MSSNSGSSRRAFLGKATAFAAVVALNPASIFLPSSDVLASGNTEPLGDFIIDLSIAKYAILKEPGAQGSLLITVPKLKFPNDKIIVTRVDEKTFVTFTAYCTHKQSTLEPFDGATFICSNPNIGHGSQFNLDGTVAQAPATKDLTQYTTTYDVTSGIVRVTLPLLAVGDNTTSVAPELFQNVPNPVGATTAIRFKLGSYSHVNLNVTDNLGHIIAVLTDGELATGDYTFYFDASIFASGTYFFHLRTQGEVLTKQMLIVK